MSTGKALKTVDQRTVVFYEDKLTSVRVEDGTVYTEERVVRRQVKRPF